MMEYGRMQAYTAAVEFHRCPRMRMQYNLWYQALISVPGYEATLQAEWWDHAVECK